MRMIRRSGTVGCGCVGLLLLVACASDVDTDDSLAGSSDEFRSGNRMPRHGARRGHGRHGHGRGHGHGHGHGHGGDGPDGGPGSGASAGSGFAGGAGMGSGTAGAGAGSSTGGASTGGGSGGGSSGFAGSGIFGGAGGGPSSGVCGDGMLWFDEECDDGNVTGGDGCDDTCAMEPGFACPWGEACHEVVCGDSLQDYYAVGGGIFDYEQCDDGNALAGDGCSNVCDIETGFVCQEPGVLCREVVCGDGRQEGYFIPPGEGGTGGAGGSGGGMTGGFAGAGGGYGDYGTYYFEGCDDGNVTPSDGCSATCVVEAGYVCDWPGQPCRVPRCGDGFIDLIPDSGGSGGAGGYGGGYGTYEQCDDGNTSASDGCDEACVVEPGFACWYPGTPCHAIVCGDGLPDWPQEQCDDGNTIPDDGCTNCVYDGGGGFGGFAGTGGFGTGGTSGTGGAFPMGGSGG